MATLKSLPVIGFESHVGIDYYFNQFDERFDSSEKIDFSEDAWKYWSPLMKDAKKVFEAEKCIGVLKEMNIEY